MQSKTTWCSSSFIIQQTEFVLVISQQPGRRIKGCKRFPSLPLQIVLSAVLHENFMLTINCMICVQAWKNFICDCQTHSGGSTFSHRYGTSHSLHGKMQPDNEKQCLIVPRQSSRMATKNYTIPAVYKCLCVHGSNRPSCYWHVS